jgi:hypothetical protein
MTDNQTYILNTNLTESTLASSTSSASSDMNRLMTDS